MPAPRAPQSANLVTQLNAQAPAREANNSLRLMNYYISAELVLRQARTCGMGTSRRVFRSGHRITEAWFLGLVTGQLLQGIQQRGAALRYADEICQVRMCCLLRNVFVGEPLTNTYLLSTSFLQSDR